MVARSFCRLLIRRYFQIDLAPSVPGGHEDLNRETAVGICATSAGTVNPKGGGREGPVVSLELPGHQYGNANTLAQTLAIEWNMR